MSNGFDFDVDGIRVSARRCNDGDGRDVVELTVENMNDHWFLASLCLTPEQALKVAAALSHEAALIGGVQVG